MLTRRLALRGLAGGVAWGAMAMPGLGFAAAPAPTEKRLVLIILRGGLDGLAAVPPYADRDYRSVRGALALPEPGAAGGMLDLDGKFGLHPALAPLHPFYKKGEMVAVHALAAPYRDRSHFDAQDLLENGTDRPRGAADGWLNRALTLMNATRDTRLGLAIGQAIPLALRGDVPVASWAPTQIPEAEPDFLQRVTAMYRRDPLLQRALADGIKAHDMSAAAMEGGAMERERPGPGNFKVLAEAGGKLLAAKGGARVAVLEIGGWDTHQGQNGRLDGPLAQLADGIAAMHAALGPAWRQTAIVAVTEFGRTVAPNGTNGTDHGTAGAAFVIGGAVAGGRVATRWPGLSTAALYEGRDLAPTADMRGLFKGLLSAHLGLPTDALDRVVFPGAAAVPAFTDLIRA